MLTAVARRHVAVILICATVSGCTAPAATARPVPSPAPTLAPPATVIASASSTPTVTLRPTVTLTPAPTITPAAPLSQSGPWLIFLATSGGGPSHLWAANPDGSAVRELTSETVFTYDVRPRRVADGQAQIAYISSSDELGRVNLTLKLLTLPDGKSRTLTRLTSAETAYIPNDATPDWKTSQIIFGLNDWSNVTWSPDGRWLAFGGAQNGPSIDVYSYEVATGEIRRLTSGPDHATNLAWSSDSHFIVHTTASYFDAEGGPDTHGVWAVRPDGSQIIQLEDPAQKQRVAWLAEIAPDRFVALDTQQGYFGPLRLLTIAAGESQPIGGDRAFEDLEFDCTDHVILVYAHFKSEGFSRVGWYLLEVSGKPTYITDRDEGKISWDNVAQLFVVTPIDKLPFGITPGGKVIDTPDLPPFRGYPSPDGKMSVLIPRLESPAPGIYLSRSGESPMEVSGQHNTYYGVRWSQDSQSFVYASDSEILAAHAPDFIPVKVSGDLAEPSSPYGGSVYWFAFWTP